MRTFQWQSVVMVRCYVTQLQVRGGWLIPRGLAHQPFQPWATSAQLGWATQNMRQKVCLAVVQYTNSSSFCVQVFWMYLWLNENLAAWMSANKIINLSQHSLVLCAVMNGLTGRVALVVCLSLNWTDCGFSNRTGQEWSGILVVCLLYRQFNTTRHTFSMFWYLSSVKCWLTWNQTIKTSVNGIENQPGIYPEFTLCAQF